MKQARVKQTMSYAEAVTLILMFTGALTASAVTPVLVGAQSGGWLAGIIITIVNFFIKLVLMIV